MSDIPPADQNRNFSLDIITPEQLAFYEGFPKKTEIEKIQTDSPNYQEAQFLLTLHERKQIAYDALLNLQNERQLDDFMNDTTADSTALLLELGESTAALWFHRKSPEVIADIKQMLQLELDLAADGSAYPRDEVPFDGVYYDFNDTLRVKLRSLFRFSGIIDRKSAELRYTDLDKTYTLKKNLGKFIEGMMKHIETISQY